MIAKSVTRPIQSVKVGIAVYMLFYCTANCIRFAGCRKGNRDCVYPEPTTSKSSRSNAKSKSSPQESISSAEEFDHDGKEPLPSIPDDDEDSTDAPLAGASGNHSRREASDTPSLTHDRSPSPSTEGSTTLASRPSLSRSV